MIDINTVINLMSLLGVLYTLLKIRKIESIKAEAARFSDYQRQWSVLYFECCQEFMNALEEELCILTEVTSEKNIGASLDKAKEQLRFSQHTIRLTLLRMDRFVMFAPNSGEISRIVAEECVTEMQSLIAAINSGYNGIVSLEKIRTKIKEFNRLSREAHSEMLAYR